MLDTLSKPFEVYFNGVKYCLLSQGRYYLSQSTTNAGRRNAKSLHVAIWEYYSGKKVPKGYCIHHKDGNTFNNSIDNLECVEISKHLSEHSKKNWEKKEFRERGIQQLNDIRGKASDWHKSEEGLAWHRDNKKNYSKPVAQYDLKGKLVRKYESMTLAAEETGVCYSCIAKCAKGVQKTSGGYIWKYVEDLNG